MASQKSFQHLICILHHLLNLLPIGPSSLSLSQIPKLLFMDPPNELKLFFAASLFLAAAIVGAQGYAVVTGTVFCDQCKDGQISLYDYPMNGVRVKVTCADGNGGVAYSREEPTNLFGSFTMRFDGTPDLSGCSAEVSGSVQGTTTGCGVSAGPAKSLRLVLRMFDMEMYAADSLLSQPAQPMPFCSGSVNPVPPPVTKPLPPSPSPPPLSPPPLSLSPSPLSPPQTLPPLPQLPPLPPLPSLPPMPFWEAYPCQHENWTNPAYRCYWGTVNPDTKVAVVFGLVAASRYGTDLTLWTGLQGRGDLYKALLREGITAFLNSYNTLHFPFSTLSVIQRMNWGLLGSPRAVLLTALRFKRANSGYGRRTCNFNPCRQ